MEPKHAGRFTIILISMLIPIVFGVLPIYRWFDPSASKLNLKPGIDISGGTSLIYEIRVPPGQDVPDDLSSQVADALKKRVDPNGVMNLVWRPQGPTRLEIQMPLAQKSGEASAIRERFRTAQMELERTNISIGEVKSTLLLADAAARKAKFEQLAMGSPQRAELFEKLQKAKRAFDAAASANPVDVVAKVDAERRMEQIEKEILATNLSIRRVETDLELLHGAVAKAEKKKEQAAVAAAKKDMADKLAAYKAEASFPARIAAIDGFVENWTAYQTVKDQVDDAETLKRLLRGSGVLEFYILVEDPQLIQQMAQRLREEGPTVKPNDTVRWYEVERPDDFGHAVTEYAGKQWALVHTTEDKALTHEKHDWGLRRAHADTDPQTGRQVVAFEFDDRGAVLFGQLTGSNIKRPLAIVLDDKLISAPMLQSRIDDRGQITGRFSSADIEYMVRTLNAGSLPARLADEPVSTRIIGPSLGAENLRRGLISGIAGLAATAIMMIGYYYFSGLVATIAVVMNLVIIMGILSMFNATYTLPGIAALVLTVGMAVDANVLIYERLREEQMRGLSIRMALRNAYDRALSAIVDSNVTTIATSLILYWFGSEEVKGFGLTLAIGVTSSLFTALFVTRTIFDWWLEKYGMRKLGSLPLTFPKWDQMMNPKVDWMGMAWIFYVVSWSVIALGVIGFVKKGREMLDIEFASGTSVQVELNRPMARNEVFDLVDKPEYRQILPAPQVAMVGTDRLEYEIITPNDNARDVRETILKALEGNIKVEAPSKFDRFGDSFDMALDRVVLPIETGKLISLGDFTAFDTGPFDGGVAILLKDIDPKLSPAQIEDRITRTRLEPGSNLPFLRVQVQSPNRDDKVATDRAIVLVSQPDVDYTKDMQLAAPVWQLVKDSVGRQSDLKSVSNFDPQVAGTMVKNAVIALALAVAFMLIYIWIRFGNVKYGGATVIALAHDVLMTIGLIGISQYIADTAVGRALLIEPFRINLTMVAAILTVMGYSVNDTIVVFDRIRENRGKYGHFSRQIINESVTQTLSRTLLTGGSTIVTLFVMYIWGGPGIHGFTFALLGGILIGTYSSFAIAAPILLLGKGDQATSAEPRSAVVPVPRAAS